MRRPQKFVDIFQTVMVFQNNWGLQGHQILLPELPSGHAYRLNCSNPRSNKHVSSENISPHWTYSWSGGLYRDLHDLYKIFVADGYYQFSNPSYLFFLPLGTKPSVFHFDIGPQLGNTSSLYLLCLSCKTFPNFSSFR